MRVVTHESFKEVYTNDPAAGPGRIEAILNALEGKVDFEDAITASEEDIAAIHTASHIARVKGQGLYPIAALAAGAAVQAAKIGMHEPCFAIVRPPGHHASADHAWGFCYFNNIAVALDHLRRSGIISTAYILDFDLHYGDGTVSILKEKGYVAIHNPHDENREQYLSGVSRELSKAEADIIGISAGFDNHVEDWGGLLRTEDYYEIGQMVRETFERLSAGCFAVLEGGYNHRVLGQNVLAFLKGLEGSSEL